MDEIVVAHADACRIFGKVTQSVRAGDWHAPTPCSEWDAAALVEHVIGFHEFLVLRPLGVRANRPKTGTAARWAATAHTLHEALSEPGTLDRELELPGGGTTRLRDLLPSLTNDVIVHTWDLSRATGIDTEIDPDLVERAYAVATSDPGFGGGNDMFDPAVPVPDDAPVLDKLVALSGRDPAWAPPG